jgi:hypothetical protein
MKAYQGSIEQFTERPYYTLEDIERICIAELMKVNLYPTDPEPVRIERFIEKKFGVSPQYDDLPDDLLGFTRFGSQGVEAIVVSRSLAEEGSKTAERRINTTLAHEAGHGLLHVHLFALEGETPTLFGDSINQPSSKILCREDILQDTTQSKHKGYDGRWWEYQANRAMGALLLPLALVEKCLQSLLIPQGVFGRKVLAEPQRERAVRLLAQTFEVNPIVARIRIFDIFPGSNNKQLTL